MHRKNPSTPNVPCRQKRAPRRLAFETFELRQLLAGDLTRCGIEPSLDEVAAPSQATEMHFESGLIAEGEAVDDLVAFAQALTESGTILYGANWSSEVTTQRELFEDGSKFLPFVEVTNPDHTLNQVGIDAGISVFPTWEFPDGSRLIGIANLQVLSERAEVPIPQSETPFITPIADVLLESGSPLHVPIDAYDPNGSALRVVVTSSAPEIVEVTKTTGNRSLSIQTEGYGEMVFELFEQRAPRPSERIITLAESGFYDGVLFHRVVPGFVIQGGDPTGTGSGGSTFGDFDDQYHLDLQHNREGVLSYAKSVDDTNDSQFFITEVPTPSLNFNYSVFGQLTEGFEVRDAISRIPNSGSPLNRPQPFDAVISEATVFDDQENSLVMLRALGNAGETATITVTIENQEGFFATRSFDVTIADPPANQNGAPFLNDIAEPIITPVNTPVSIPLSAQDLEGDTLVFRAVQAIGQPDFGLEVDSATGEVIVTPPENFVGQLQFLATVEQTVPTTPFSSPDDNQVITVHVGTPDLVAFAQALNASDTTFFGAAWDELSTSQREMFEDGGQYLPFMEVTEPDGTLNQLGIVENISTFPTWQFPDGSRAMGVQSLEVLSERSGVPIPLGAAPHVADILDLNIEVGSPLHIPVDAYDPEGRPLTITVESSDATRLEASVLDGNRSLNVSTIGFGDMVVELFEQRVPRPTERIVQLVEDGFYDGLNFHRVFEEFVIQAGDPTGTGNGGSTLGPFDDQYHLDLLHNGPGVVGFAKGSHDTNDSQFYITELASPHLDYEFTVFGRLVEGESVRESISQTPTDFTSPIRDVNIESASIFEDRENGVLFLKPTENGQGTVTITVTVTDADGFSVVDTFDVTIDGQQGNKPSFLNDIPAVRVPKNQPGTMLLTSQDREGDPPIYSVVASGNTTFDILVDPSTGEVSFTPPQDFTGELQYLASVSDGVSTGATDRQLVSIFVGSTHQNVVDPFDVNADTFLSAVDALLVINHLNNSPIDRVEDLDAAPPFLDVNGDLFLSAVDALMVINQLNMPTLPGGEGESSLEEGRESQEAALFGDWRWIDERRWVNELDDEMLLSLQERN